MFIWLLNTILNTCLTCPKGKICDATVDPQGVCPKLPCGDIRPRRPILQGCPEGYTSDEGAAGINDSNKYLYQSYLSDWYHQCHDIDKLDKEDFEKDNPVPQKQ